MRPSRLINDVVGLAGVLALAMSATLALAEVKEVMKIKIKTDSGIAETVRIENLAVGDTEVFQTESGREVLVTRLEDALKMELDGEVIDVKMPRVHSAHESGDGERHLRFMHKDGHGDGQMHESDGENIWVTKDDEVVIDEGGMRHIVIHREGGDADHSGDASCDIELEFDGDMSEDEIASHIEEACVGTGEEVHVIKRKVIIESSEESDHN